MSGLFSGLCICRINGVSQFYLYGGEVVGLLRHSISNTNAANADEAQVERPKHNYAQTYPDILLNDKNIHIDINSISSLRFYPEKNL